MRFLDCNAWLGISPVRQVAPVLTTSEFVETMRREGVDGALVWHVAQYYDGPTPGNEMLAEEIAPHPELTGSWAILPDADWEMPSPDELFRRMRNARIRALRAFPARHGFFLDGLYCGKTLGAIVENRVPLFLSMRRGTDYASVYSLLREFPRLRVVLCDHSEYSPDRHLLTLMRNFPNLYLDTTCFGLHGHIERFAREFGPERLLFGSGFPEIPFKTTIYEMERLDLPEDARAAIAGGNLERLLSEVRL